MVEYYLAIKSHQPPAKEKKKKMWSKLKYTLLNELV